MPQLLSFDPLADQFVGAAPVTLTGESSSGLPVVFASLTPGTCTVAGTRLGGLAAGTCTVRATQPGDASRAPATPVDQTITISAMPASGQAFALPVNYAVGMYPDAIATGDFNGDGKLDLATANFSEGSVSILLGRGDGTFAPGGSEQAGIGPMSIVVADFNRDGKVDLAVANLIGRDVRVLLGKGDGTFTRGPAIDIGIALFGLATADIDGDGKPDLVVSNGTSDGVIGTSAVVLLGDGAGSFRISSVLPTGLNPMSVALRDVNGDGKHDLVVVDTDGNTVSVMLGDGMGGFRPRTAYAVGMSPQDVALGDVNGDGKLDLVVPNAWNNNVSVLLNRGDGSFAAATPFAAGNAPGAVVIGDFDGDGKADLVVLNQFSDDVSLLVGNGNGTFQAPRAYGVLAHPMAIVSDDFDGDGRLDLAVATTVGNAVSVLLRASSNTVSLTAAAGTPQSTAVNAPFATPLAVLARDGLGRAAAGIPVTFTTPIAGASGLFGTTRSAQAVSDATGRASAPQLVANNIVGAYTVVASSSGGATTAFSLTNVAGAIAPLFTSGPPPGGTYNTAYRHQLTASGVPAPHFSAPANALPPGLSLDALTGSITGVPTATGTFAGSFLASNGSPPDASQAFAIKVAGLAQTITFAAPPDRALGTAAFTVAASASSGLAVSVTSLTPSICSAAGNTVTLIAVGTCSLRATQAGSSSYAPASPLDRSFAVTAANRAPSIALVHPAAGYAYVAPAIISILARAADSDGKVTKVDFYNGASLLASVTTAPYRFVWTNVPAGTYAIKAIAYDDRGASAVSPVVPVVVSATGVGVSFASAVTYPAGLGGDGFALVRGDFDGDRRIDLVVGRTLTASFLRGFGNGTFDLPRSMTPSVAINPGGGASGDFNGDGKLDFVATTDKGFITALGRGDGTFNPSSATELGIVAMDLAVADLTGDTRADVVVGLGDGSVALLASNGDGTFKRSTVTTGVAPVRSVAIGDLNGDGKLDIVATSPTDRTLRVMLGSGGGAFNARSPANVASYPFTPLNVVLADFNGDNHLDAAITGYFAPSVSVLLGNGDGTFQPSVEYPANLNPYAIAAQDVNGDGKVDLVVTNDDGKGTLSVLLGNGNGTFRAPVTLAGGARSYVLTVGDLNGDGRADIATSDASGVVKVLINTMGVATRAPAFTSATPPDGVFGQPYSFTFAASGSPTPMITVNGGPPERLKLSATGVLSGAPIRGVYNLTVTAENGIAPSAKQDHTIFIRPASQTISFGPTVPTLTPGTYSVTARSSAGFDVGLTSLSPDVCKPQVTTGLQVTFASFGVCQLRADQPGDVNFARAPAATLEVRRSVAMPPVTIVSPAHRASFVAGANIAIAADARPAAPGWTLSKVTFLVDDVPVGTAVTAPYTVQLNNVAPGTYQIVARSIDTTVLRGMTAEMQTDSMAITVVVGSKAESPSVTLTSPKQGARLFAPAMLALSANAENPGGLLSHVEFYNGNFLLGTSTNPPYQFTWSGVGPGSYVITAVAVSSTGAAVSSTPATVTVEAGLAWPVAHYGFDDAWQANGLVRDRVAGTHGRRHGNVTPSVAPASGKKGDTCRAASFAGGTVDVEGLPVSLVAGARTSVAFWMRWNGADGIVPVAWSSSGLAFSQGKFGFTTFNGDIAGIPAAALTGSWHHIVAEFVNGDAQGQRLSIDGVEQLLTAVGAAPIQANASVASTLHLGGRGAGVTAQGFIGDLDEVMVFNGALDPRHVQTLAQRARACAPIAVDILSPGPQWTRAGPTEIDLIASADSLARPFTNVEFFANGTSLGTKDNRNGFVLRWKDIPAGAYSVTAVARDNAGATATSPVVPVTVTAAKPHVAPTISLSAPATGAVTTRSGRVDIAANVSATGGVAKVEFFANGSEIGGVAAPPYKLVWRPSTGVYTLTARVTDAAGATADSGPVAIRVEDPPPKYDPPAITLTAPTANAQYVQTQKITLSAAATAPGKAIARIEFAVDGTMVGSVAAPTGASTFSALYLWASALPGSHSTQATLVLTDGTRLASKAVAFVVKDLVVHIVTPAPNQSFIAPAQVHLAALPSETGGTIRRVDFYGDGVVIGSATTAPFEFTWTPVAAGKHFVTAVAVDSGGLTVAAPAVTIAVLTTPVAQVDAGIDASSMSDDNVSITGSAVVPLNSVATINGRSVPIGTDGRFFVDNVPLAAGINTLDLAVSTADGATFKKTITVTSTGSAPFKVAAEPQEGMAPLAVDVAITNRGNVPFQRIEITTRADGAPELTLTSLPETPTYARLTFSNPGLFTIQIKAFNAAGAVIYTAKRRVLARDPRDVAGTVVETYKGLVDRLRAGNTTAALNVFTAGIKDKYAKVFSSLQSSLPTIADQLGTIVGVTVSWGLSEITLVRNTASGPQAFHVYAIRSEDGIWRIDGM